MGVAEGNERRFVTLPVEYWTYLEEKAKASKDNCRWYGGRHTVSEELKKMVKVDMDMKKAGFLN
ncbi:hypothetical protein [Enterococcus phoeniculicola]|uniref:Uncharacterized protein n=1 Tax=Enterococcus phoeniculicola ATCC BAA-412 TaxID=1158610 RepID=R3WX02_9ENTE|nr:hypothetical protein [Enterococcus phoeniculicola]EOL46305.1 hypothetical protein UC3_01111 [Enterococcus phoeniculicola ATCC BAA-412]EOT76850.1 hypothetical protein I589_01811 [Enterococcus phoeniculicola ATCC BAA-412]